MLSTTKSFYTCNCQEVGTYTLDFCAHADKHLGKLLQIWLAGCIIDRCSTLGKRCRHEDICCSCNGSLVKKHISTF